MNLGSRYSQHSFAQVPTVHTTRSSFDRSFTAKDTMDFDLLTPFFVDEILPGDTVNLNTKTFARLAPQIRPLMDNMYLDYFFFFVPNRLVWNNFEKFMGAQDNPGDTTDYIIPTITAPAIEGFMVGSIYDKLGLPTGIPGIEINALPLRAYNLIVNNWFRDQNLVDSLIVSKDDGPDGPTEYDFFVPAKPHDYFTSALPFPQKGDAITLPLGSAAPVISNNENIKFSTNDANNFTDGTMTWRTGSPNAFGVASIGPAASGVDVFYDGSQTGLRVDLSEATAATINSLRMAFMMQSLLELDARGGTRYIEIIQAHFNVTNPDYRLQRPELLSTGRVNIAQHPIAQTSESGTTPQGNLAAFSTASEMGSQIGFSKSFTEHGYVLGLVRARGEITYQQGLHKMWTRSTKYDFFWPKLQELGEQSVLKQEIMATGTSTDTEVWGYQERYAEYRYSPSQIRGQFRSTYPQSLDVWHLAQEFATVPELNEDFIKLNTPIERVLTVTEGYPHLLVDYYFNYKHVRPMVTYGVPATLGRF